MITRIIHKGIWRFLLLLAALMLFITLPAIAAAADETAEAVVVEVSLLSDVFEANPDYVFASDEALVKTAAEFTAALQNASITKIYFGANIQLTSQITVAKRALGSLTINGTDPTTGNRYQYMDPNAAIGLYMATKTDTLIFKDIDLYIHNNDGILRIAENVSNGCTIIFDGVKAEAARLAVMHLSTMILRNSQVDIYKTGSAASKELSEVGIVIFEGNVLVNHKSTMGTPYSIFNFYSNAKGEIIVRAGADVTVKSSANSYGCFHFYSSKRTFTVENGASFTYIGRDRFCKLADNGKFDSFTIGEQAEVILITPESNTQGSGAGVLFADTVTVNKGGSLEITANTSLYAVLRTTNLNLNSPRRVFVYNAGAGNAVSSDYATALDVTGLKSMRYYSSTANYANNIPSKWFFQEDGSFFAKVLRWGSDNASLQSTDYTGKPPYNTIASGSDIRSYGAKVVEIIGNHSSPPTVNSVMEGMTEIAGSGIAEAKITVSSPSTGTLDTVTVNAEGKWAVTSARPFVRDETVTVTQEEKITASGNEAIYAWKSDPATTIVLRKEVALVPSNNTKKTYSHDRLGVEINSPRGAPSFTVDRVDYVIFNNPDEDFSIKDGGAFAGAFASANMKKGTITAFTANGDTYTAALPDNIQYNCAVWARATMMIDGAEVVAYDSVSYRNIYTPYPIYVRAVINGRDPVDELYGYTLTEGFYGIPYMGNGAIYANGGSYGFAFDKVTLALEPDYSNHWSAKVGGENAPHTMSLDDGFFKNTLCDNEDISKYTLQCTKVPNMWWENVTVYYCNESGASVPFDDPDNPEGPQVSQGIISVPLTGENAIASENFYLLGGRYTPPNNDDTQPVGWFVDKEFDNPDINYISDFSSSEFDPEFENIHNQYLYIIYKSGQFKVEEYFVDEYADTVANPRTHTVDKDNSDGFSGVPKTVGGYVPAGYEVKYNDGSEVHETYNFDFAGFYANSAPTTNQYSLFPDLEISDVDLKNMGVYGTVTITYIYAEDSTHNGIPDSEETSFDIYWYGYPLARGIYTEIQPYISVYSRMGQYELTVTNIYPDPSGKDTHIITYQEKTWLFDQGNNEPSRTVTTDGSQEDVIFQYGVSSDGITLDSQQYVMEDYYLLAEADDNLTDLGTSMGLEMVKTYILKGEAFNKTPGVEMTANGKTYLYVGYRLEDENGEVALDGSGDEIRGDINNFTYSWYGEMPVPLSITVPLARYRIVYLYREKASPATVIWEGKTYANNKVLIGSMVLNGYLGEKVTAESYDVDTGTTWKFTGSYKGEDKPEYPDYNDSLTFTLSNFAQSGRFTYAEASTEVIITFQYIGDDGGLNIKYTVDTQVNGRPITVNIFPLSGYEASGWILEDSQGMIMYSGESIGNIPATVDPAEGSQTLTITYKSTLTSLHIRCIDVDTDEEMENQRIDDISVGKPYAARAPYVEKYALAPDENLLKSIMIESGVNEIIFYYEEITGGTLILREAVYDGGVLQEDQGAIIECRNLDAEPGSDVDIPNLEKYYYTTVSTVVKQYDESNPVTYYYDKQMMDVVILPVDEDGDSLNASGTLRGAARKGEMYLAVTDITVPGYTLADSVSKYVYADPSQTIVTVPFTYSKDAQGDVTVKYYYHNADNAGAETVLNSITLTAIVGSKFTISAEVFNGFELAEGETASKEIMVAASGNEISFRYTDIRKSVTVKSYIPNGAGGWTASGVPELYRFMGGGDGCYIVAGPIASHVLVGYAVDDGSGSMMPVTLGTTQINIGPVNGELTVYLYYKAVDNVVAEYYSEIAVVGKEGAADMYRYSLRVPKAGGGVSVTAFTYAGKIVSKTVIGSAEQGGAPTEVIIDPAAGDQTVTFTYASNLQSITIYTYMYGTTNQVISPIVIPDIENGSRYSYDSPSIPGYQLVDGSGANLSHYTATIDRVGGTANTIAFYYKDAVGQQTVIYKDSETLAEFSRDTRMVAVNMEETIAIPEIDNYTAYTTEAATVTWDGDSELPDIVYEYTRNKASVTLAAYDTVTGSPIEGSGAAVTSTLEGKRVLENYDYSGDVGALTALVQEASPGCSLAPLGGTLTHVSADSASNMENVWYTPPLSGKITVELRADSPTGNLLHSYMIPAASGQTITLDESQIPSIPGYEFNSGLSILTATEGTTGTIIVVLTDNRHTVAVKTVAGLTTSTAATYKVVDGGSLDISVPYVAGYMLKSYQINDSIAEDGTNASKIAVNNITADMTITLTYAPIEEAADEYTVKITVVGFTAAGQNEAELYKYVTPVANNTGSYTGVKPFAQNGYALIAVYIDGVEVTGNQWVDGILTLEIGKDDMEVRFKYVELDKITIYISGKTASGEGIYSYERAVACNSGAYMIEANTIPGYILVDVLVDNFPQGSGSSSVNVTANESDIYVEFIYREFSATVTIHILEDGTGQKILPDFTVDAVEGQPFTYNAPDLTETGSYYYLAEQTSDNPEPASTIGRIDSVAGDGSSEIKFFYKQISSSVIFVAKEDDAGGRIIMIQEIQPDNWISGETYLIPAPVLRNDYYDYIGYDESVAYAAGDSDNDSGNIVAFKYDSSNTLQIVEIYYLKQLMNIPIIIKGTNTNGTIITTQTYNDARVGEMVYINAPNVSGYTLADMSTKVVLAVENAEVEFFYTANDTSMGSLTIKITTSATGSALPGAAVTIKNSGETAGTQIRTDSNGLVELNNLAFGAYTITASYGEYNSGTAEISATGLDAFVLIALGTTTSGGDGGSGNSGGSGGAMAVTYTVTYNASGGTGSHMVPGIAFGKNHTVVSLTAAGIRQESDYTFTGWNTKADGTGTGYAAGDNLLVKGDITLYAQWIWDEKQTGIHAAYLNGYSDGSVRPNGAITRAEATAIIFRILNDENKTAVVTGKFADVSRESWYVQEVNYLFSLNVLNGYPDGTFRPNGLITRAEFTAIVARFNSLAPTTGDTVFGDVASGHWAAGDISAVYAAGWITGYPDGTFRPENNITRAEAVKIVNAMLGRKMDDAALAKVKNRYNDISSSHWAYMEILEASVVHEYERDKKGIEVWKFDALSAKAE